MTEPSRAVFVSYASQDADAAGRLCEALLASGIEVWFDRQALRGGDAWDQRIRREIRECALFIPLVSAHTEARLEGYFRREWKLAVDRTHDMADERAFLLPVVLDATNPLAARVPEPFLAAQWTHLPAGHATPAFIARVAQLLAASQPGNVPSPRRPTASGTARRVAVAEPEAIPPHSVAVLPFVNLSADKEQEYFSDGLAEELINLLARIPELRVPARTSSFSFRGRPVTAGEIGQALKVANVLEGSVRKAGDRVRVTVQLVRSDNGYHLWSETFDRTLEDIFRIQDEIAQAVVEKLKLTLLAPLPSACATGTNIEAHNLYLQGQYFRSNETQADLVKAIDCYRRALALDPEYALAWAGLSAVYVRQVANSYVVRDEGYAQVRAAAERALALDPALGEAYSALIIVLLNVDHDWAGSRTCVARARELGVENPLLLLSAAVVEVAVGEAADAVALMREALDLDPLNFLVRRYYARTLYYAGRLQEAEAEIRHVLELSTAYPVAHYELGRILLAQGRADDAFAAFQAEAAQSWRLYGLILGHHALGHAADARDALAELLRDPAGSEFQVAETYAWLGDADQAFRWLDVAIASRDPGVMWMRGDPLLAALTTDARYVALLRSLHMPL